MKQSIEETVQQYTDTWNLENADEIRAGFEKCLSPGCTYTDKNTPGFAGPQSFTDLAMKSHELSPGRRFTLTSVPEYFSNKGRYFWRVSFPDKPARDCMDYFEFNNENKITAIVGFV
ncbi:MAG: hypothetical protein QM726_18800 [Chitinophagaceae bacterium]